MVEDAGMARGSDRRERGKTGEMAGVAYGEG